MKINPAASFSLLAVFLLVPLFLAGCATTPPVDWNARIGNCTFDQAAAELGQPDRQAKLEDGRRVAKWIARAPANSHLNTGMSYYGSTGFSTSQPAAAAGEQMLQLTFGTNGTLVDWSKNY